MEIWNLDKIFDNVSKAALIILNQPLPDAMVRQLWPHCPITICADGGANRLKQLNLTPQVIIGDLDSLDSDVESFYSNVKIIRIDDQDSNDFEKCIQMISNNQEIEKILAIGALGGRFDHQMANINILYKYPRLKIFLISKESIVFLLDSGQHRIHSIVDDTFKSNCGLIPIGSAALVKTSGLEWDLGV